MGDPSVKAYSIENGSLDPSATSYSDESWMDTPLNNGIREITVSVYIYNCCSFYLLINLLMIYYLTCIAGNNVIHFF